MQTQPIQLTDVIYNAATQSFEALVTVHDADRTQKYMCAINAPITMTFEDAADGLTRQAVRRHRTGHGPSSEILRQKPALRAGRRAFDPLRWLDEIIQLPGRRAA
tara:strand:- start:3998 stop:4312 length:315 start_codon:yes stop_codon:yes gene_type:complete